MKPLMTASYSPYSLIFKRASGTSRGVLHTKDTWILKISDGDKMGIGECALFKGLSVDDVPDYEDKLNWLCNNIHLSFDEQRAELHKYPSILFGLETALRSLAGVKTFELYPSEFTKGKRSILINGLVWMGDFAFMREQIIAKIKEGFTCIKLKIGAIEFNQELELLSAIRSEFGPSDIELRVDANGAFNPDEALEKLKRLSEYQLHSIEQPIKPNQWEAMAELCDQSPLDIALDEELIRICDAQEKRQLLSAIRPQYIILKPALVGGFCGSEEWIKCAEDLGIGWWITSALESNIGLNAIAQWTYSLNNSVTQGLGTGGLFTNNFDSPLTVSEGQLYYEPKKSWKIKF